jgi:catechol 2,3-dioxygenase-like lactoylglutathione lyase family enzyme
VTERSPHTPASGLGLNVPTINTVVRYVRDQNRSVAFWTGPLGFELRRDSAGTPGPRWVEVAPRGRETGIALLGAVDFDADPHGGDAAFTLVVLDLRDWHARMVAAGVTVSEPVDEGAGLYATFTCVDGYQHVVSQPAPPATA